ncbi:glucose-1-phosphate thymidylyltransferase [Nitrosopumilus adriaticus]|uniref:glucose-1-phosphate thymidylyltransferase n=1 Tax=Nitrosopumilus adriaticus TaxID=1580092 RepID=UPI00352EC422
MKGIILHGGHGTRLRPLTHTGPKQLLPIANKPMSQYGIESMIDSGVNEIAIIIGGIGSDKVKEYYGNGEKFGVKFSYIEQDEPRGISHAISLCKNFIKNEKFLVFLGDNILKDSISNYVEEFKKSDADASIVLCEVENPSRFGIADIENNKIKKIIEKPKDPPTNLAVIGVYLLTPKIFNIIDRLKPSWRNELEITDALQMLLEEKNKIIYNTVSENWKDTGTPEDIIQANDIILRDFEPYFLGIKEEGVTINGNVMVGKNSTIKRNVLLMGPVIIGENCVIESGTIGPNASIGNNCRIAKCNLSNSIIMENCEIDSESTIEKSIISKNSKIIQKHDANSKKILLLGEGTKIYL